MSKNLPFLPEIRRAARRIVGVREILGVIDGLQKLILTRDELNTHLAHLLDRGEIRELPDRRFGPGEGLSAVFKPLSDAEYEAALAAYQSDVERSR